jgi:hypothetical protein
VGLVYLSFYKGEEVGQNTRCCYLCLFRDVINVHAGVLVINSGQWDLRLVREMEVFDYLDQ